MATPLSGVQASGAPEPRAGIDLKLTGSIVPNIIPLPRRSERTPPPALFAGGDVVYIAVPISHSAGRRWHIRALFADGRIAARGRHPTEAQALAAIRRRFGRHVAILRWRDLPAVVHAQQARARAVA
jgi:hypothetical protein